MTVEIKPAPLLFELNRRPWKTYETDQYSGPYTIEFTPGEGPRFGGTKKSREEGRLSHSVKIEFNQSGPIDFMDGNREFALTEDFYTINGSGNFLFTVRVNKGMLNDQTVLDIDPPYRALINTTEQAHLVKWHELTSDPGEAVEEGIPNDIFFPHVFNDDLYSPYYVEARVYLRRVERGDGGLWYGTEVWPGGWTVGPVEESDQEKMEAHKVTYDYNQAKDRDHLWIKFKRNVSDNDYNHWKNNTNARRFDNFYDNLDPSYDDLTDLKFNEVYFGIRPHNSEKYLSPNGEQLAIKFKLSWQVNI